RKHPGKTLLQAAVIAAGALAFSTGLAMSGAICELERETYRYRISVANGSTDEAGRFEYTRPGVFTKDILEHLIDESGYIKKIAAVNETRWPAVKVGESRFSIRSVMAAEADYAAIMGLTIEAGRSYSPDESTQGARLAMLSASVAESLFGSADQAIGSFIESERGVMMVRTGQGQTQQSRLASERFEVIGVYRDPPELARTALGIPDAIIPFGADRPPGLPAQAASRIRTFVAETDGTPPETLKLKLATSLETLGIVDAELEAWEGDPATPNTGAAAEARKVIAALSGAIAGLGTLVLAASVFGIYSGTSMEAAANRKGTAVRRALGESARGTVLRFASENAGFGAAAALGGAVLSIPAYQALAGAAETVLAGAGMSQGGIFPDWPPIWAPVVAVLMTALACALFSLPPAIGASRAGIVDGIQEL
ncbi:MAG: ABC transporter permease, partial [Spirochaetota bacterium]